MAIDVREIARKVASRVLSERQLAPKPAHAEAAPAQPAQPVRAAPKSVPTGATKPPKLVLPPPEAPERLLVLGTCLADTPDGGVLKVPDDALLSPLAVEEAHRRHITIQRGARDAGRRIAVGCDHGGFALKTDVLRWLATLGFVAVDFGTRDENAVDYPDFARAVAEAVAGGQCELGIVIDGAGMARRSRPIRCRACARRPAATSRWRRTRASTTSRTCSRSAARCSRASFAHEIVKAFLSTATGEARHARCVAKITDIERRYLKGAPGGVQA